MALRSVARVDEDDACTGLDEQCADVDRDSILRETLCLQHLRDRLGTDIRAEDLRIIAGDELRIAQCDQRQRTELERLGARRRFRSRDFVCRDRRREAGAEGGEGGEGGERTHAHVRVLTREGLES